MILIADDDRNILMSLKLLLERAGYEVACASDPEGVMAAVRAGGVDLAIIDMNYSRTTSGEEGLSLLRRLRLHLPDLPVILITGWGSIELAVEGMRAGAYDFITKPWNNRVLLQRVATALTLRPSAEETEPDSVQSARFDRCGIVGENPRLLEILSTVERVARTDAPVLILGENGTGKELIARAIHANSRRRDNPFVMVNLGGIPRSLFESEMFGHVKGAFTGAVAARKGRFELADKGTVFLDEIGDLDQTSQVKLLRVLQQHTFEPVGESRSRKVDIRVVCATNADIPGMVRERTFREDLYYRINLVTLRLPPLRERRDDIPALVRHFAQNYCRENGLAVPEFSVDAMQRLVRLPYPGNIRELRNVVERAIITALSPVIDAGDIDRQCENMPDDVPQPAFSSLEDMESQIVRQALDASGGNMSKAALSLGISRQTLYRRMEKYNISGKDLNVREEDKKGLR